MKPIWIAILLPALLLAESRAAPPETGPAAKVEKKRTATPPVPAPARQTPYQVMASAAIRKVVGAFPALRFFRFFADQENTTLTKKHKLFYVSTLDITPLAPFYYVAVSGDGRRAYILNRSDGSDFNRALAAEGFSLKSAADQERLARLFLGYHIVRQDYIDRLADDTYVAAGQQIANLERKLTFYPRQDGGGRLVFFSYETGGTIQRWDLSLSARAEVQMVRFQELVRPPSAAPGKP